jgi:hypothetical protein
MPAVVNEQARTRQGSNRGVRVIGAASKGEGIFPVIERRKSDILAKAGNSETGRRPVLADRKRGNFYRVKDKSPGRWCQENGGWNVIRRRGFADSWATDCRFHPEQSPHSPQIESATCHWSFVYPPVASRDSLYLNDSCRKTNDK